MSNVYPIWWDTTITIFNRFEDPSTQQITWYKHTIQNCYWKYVVSSTTVDKTELETDNIICRVPKQNDFLESASWKSLAVNQRDSYFTLNVNDIIVKGDVTDTINEYQSGQRSTDILNKYKASSGCIKIKDFVVNTGAGRCDEHYYIIGV